MSYWGHFCLETRSIAGAPYFTCEGRTALHTLSTVRSSFFLISVIPVHSTWYFWYHLQIWWSDGSVTCQLVDLSLPDTIDLRGWLGVKRELTENTNKLTHYLNDGALKQFSVMYSSNGRSFGHDFRDNVQVGRIASGHNLSAGESLPDTNDFRGWLCVENQLTN